METPSGAQFLLNAIATLHADLARALDTIKAKDVYIAELEAKLRENQEADQSTA